jgi:hypothetical protein
MEDLEPYKIKNLDIKLERKGDLIYHEGVLLSHFIDINHPNEHYFYKWCDCDENCNRWAIFKVELTSLKLFFEGKITLLQLIEENSFIFFKDIDNNLDSVGIYVCPISKIPQDYLPDNNSYFKEALYEKYALELREKINQEVINSPNEILEVILKEVLSIRKTISSQKTNI